MKNYFSALTALILLIGQYSCCKPAAEKAIGAQTFVSRDTIDTFLEIAKALEAHDFARVTELVNANPEILDNTIRSETLLFSKPNKGGQQQLNAIMGQLESINLSRFLSRFHEHHILDVAAKYGNSEIVTFLLQKFLERQKIPLPHYAAIDKYAGLQGAPIVEINEVIKNVTGTSSLEGAANPLAYAAANGRLKLVKTIVEFVKKYYKDRNMPLPRSFFDAAFVGTMSEGVIPDLAKAIADTRNNMKRPIGYLVGGALPLALYFGHNDVAQYLIDEGALDDKPQYLKYGFFPGDGYLPVIFNENYDPTGKWWYKNYTVDLEKYAREAGLHIPTSKTTPGQLAVTV